VDFVVRPWVNTVDYWPVHFAITEQMKLRLDAEHISIPFPQRDVHMFQPKN
jgi:small conductance mechanosensitive channel